MYVLVGDSDGDFTKNSRYWYWGGKRWVSNLDNALFYDSVSELVSDLPVNNGVWVNSKTHESPDRLYSITTLRVHKVYESVKLGERV